MDLFPKQSETPCRVHPFFVFLCTVMILCAVAINALGLYEQFHGNEPGDWNPFWKNHLLLVDKLAIPLALLAWTFIVVADVRGSNNPIHLATCLLVVCSVLKIVGQVQGEDEMEVVQREYTKYCVNATKPLEKGGDKCFEGVYVDTNNPKITLYEELLERYSTAFLQTTSRGLMSNIFGLVLGMVILNRAVFPGREELSMFEQRTLEKIILKDNIVFFCSVFSAMLFVLSQATACLGDHRLNPENCYSVISSCSLAMYFGCAAFAVKILIFPFKTTSYNIGDFMRFDLRFHEQVQALIGVWSVVLVLFVFASGAPLKGYSFYTYVHTGHTWGYKTRDAAFSFCIMFMLLGLSITEPKAEHIRKYSERQARRSRRLSRLSDYLRVKMKSSKSTEWAPAFRYCLLAVGILLNTSSIAYFVYAQKDGEEYKFVHDYAIFLVSCGFLLCLGFSMTKPRTQSFWQAQLPKSASELNFLFVAIISFSKGNIAWGFFEAILAASGLILTPIFLKARKFLAHFGDADINKHLSSNLSTVFVVIPSVAYLIAEVTSCYTHEKEEGKDICFPLFLSNWTVSMWIGLTAAIGLSCGITFKNHTMADWIFLKEPTLSSIAHILCGCLTTSTSFYIFGLRGFNVSQKDLSFDPLELNESAYRDASQSLIIYSVALAVFVIIIITIDGFILAIKNAYLQSLDEAHEEEEFEHTVVYTLNSFFTKIEQKLNIKRFSVPDDVARVSPFYEELFLYACIIVCLTQMTGTLFRMFGTEPIQDIGIIITTTYCLGFIPHSVLVLAYIFSDLEKNTTERKKRNNSIAKWSIHSLFIANGISYAYEGHDKWLKWVLVDIVIIGSCASVFKGAEKNRRACAESVNLLGRRQHLVLCLKIMAANLPTQLYFIGEVVACMIRQKNYKKYVPDTPFELLDNSCNGVLYGITPIAIFNGWCIVQFINYGFHHEMQHDVRNVIRLRLTPFQIYRVANSAVLIIIAVFAYGLRSEMSYKDTDKTKSSLFWFIWTGLFLVLVEVGLTSFKLLYGYISSVITHAKTPSRRSLLPSDKSASDFEDRMGNRDKSMWDGGSKGTPIDLTATQRMQARKELLSKDKSVAVFEISPGFL
ncbi:hypothetical protein TrVE_jg1777 [Triparma verrucosa]|uniref:Uncharacterized protein n=1 Tax=Triparma verrucosa TaxID=1606542 RepID=A0A9W7FHE1_9STRA|nr:hypothetical protein TrVE_jg1777 [Triparma verrucosa]